MSQHVPRVKPNKFSGRKPFIPPRLNKQHYLVCSLQTELESLPPGVDTESLPWGNSLCSYIWHYNTQPWTRLLHAEQDRTATASAGTDEPDSSRYLWASQHGVSALPAHGRSPISAGLPQRRAVHFAWRMCRLYLYPSSSPTPGAWVLHHQHVCHPKETLFLLLPLKNISIQHLSLFWFFPRSLSTQSFFGVIAFESHFKN